MHHRAYVHAHMPSTLRRHIHFSPSLCPPSRSFSLLPASIAMRRPASQAEPANEPRASQQPRFLLLCFLLFCTPTPTPFIFIFIFLASFISLRQLVRIPASTRRDATRRNAVPALRAVPPHKLDSSIGLFPVFFYLPSFLIPSSPSPDPFVKKFP
jgi:hypothetical protein